MVNGTLPSTSRNGWPPRNRGVVTAATPKAIGRPKLSANSQGPARSPGGARRRRGSSDAFKAGLRGTAAG